MTLLRAVGAVVGKELRAFNNWHGVRNPGPRPIGLGVWLLNMNLGRDSREWRRGRTTGWEWRDLTFESFGLAPYACIPNAVVARGRARSATWH